MLTQPSGARLSTYERGGADGRGEAQAADDVRRDADAGRLPNGEVASALQKAIRRGNEREALYWASELDLAGFGGYVWKRLRIIASEDVGLGDTEAVIAVRCLYENWLEAKKAKDESALPLWLLNAVLVLARAKKSGIVVHAWMAFYEGDRQAMGIEIPDHALDMHTGARPPHGSREAALPRRGREARERGAARPVFRRGCESVDWQRSAGPARRPAAGGSARRSARTVRRGQPRGCG